MTITEAHRRYSDVAATAGDSEAAHGMEDDFHEDVLRAIAEGAPHPDRLAKIALKTLDLDFQRWCA